MSNSANSAQSPLDRFLSQTTRAQHRSFTHRPLEDILKELGIGRVKRGLLWLAKTDFYVLYVSTYYSQISLLGLGMMVAFTSMLAFCSGLYTLLTTLVAPDSAFRWPIALLLAAIYAFGIMIIDREMVGAQSNKTLLIRLVFAVFIATAVSWPVKLKFFEGRVLVEINRMIDEKNSVKLQRINELKRTGENERIDQRKAIQNHLDSLDKEIVVLDEQIKRESKIVECGPKCQEYRGQKEKVMLDRKLVESQLAALAMPEMLPETIRAEIKTLEDEVRREHDVSYDFLTKWEALSRIKDNSPDYQLMSYFIFIFFMALELVPLLVKISMSKTEYNYYLEARTNLNNQKIIALSNMFMGQLKDAENPQKVLQIIPLEITDIIAAFIEDEARPQTHAPDFRGLQETFGQNDSGQYGPEGQVRTPGNIAVDARKNQDQIMPDINQSHDETKDEPPPNV